MIKFSEVIVSGSAVCICLLSYIATYLDDRYIDISSYSFSFLLYEYCN